MGAGCLWCVSYWRGLWFQMAAEPVSMTGSCVGRGWEGKETSLPIGKCVTCSPSDKTRGVVPQQNTKPHGLLGAEQKGDAVGLGGLLRWALGHVAHVDDPP